jgi:hypothetical protein
MLATSGSPARKRTRAPARAGFGAITSRGTATASGGTPVSVTVGPQANLSVCAVPSQ